MNLSRTVLITVCLFAACLYAEVRTFTSTAGTTIRGELVKVAGEMVTIKTENGRMLTVKAALFSAADVTYLQSQGLKATPSAAVAPVAGGKSNGEPNRYTNSLGMIFVPVPGTSVMMCIHETRRKDYVAYVRASGVMDGRGWEKTTWMNRPVSDGYNDPVINVTWEHARAFCAWLGKKEGRTYRLPTDREWSVAVDIGDRERPDASAEALDGKLTNVYPWGAWPLIPGAGNYRDTAHVKVVRPDKNDQNAATPGFLDGFGYTDDYSMTSTVMKFKPNALGIYDLGGNVWELCEDVYGPGGGNNIVSRGASFASIGQPSMLSSKRNHLPRDDLEADVGFRCVVEIVPTSP